MYNFRDYFEKILMFLGSITCHQLDSRSFFIVSSKLPYCARDTGIYFGFIFVFIYLIIKRRLKADKPPSISVGIVICLLLTPMLIDAGTSYLNLRETTNIIRIITGMLFGSSLPYLIIPLWNFKIRGTNKVEVVKSPYEVLILAVVTCVVGLIVFVWQKSFYFLPAALTCAGMLTFLWYLTYTPFKRIKGISKRKSVLAAAGTVILVLTVLWSVGRLLINLSL